VTNRPKDHQDDIFDLFRIFLEDTGLNLLRLVVSLYVAPYIIGIATVAISPIRTLFRPEPLEMLPHHGKDYR
jgi:hypothetical protein